MNRAWMKGLYEVDPDSVYFRSVRSLLGVPERQLLRDTAAVLEFRSTSDPLAWLAPGERDQLASWLSERPTVEQVGRYRFDVDGREIDLTAVVTGGYEPDPTAVVG
ncbi:hypothetical protein ACPEEZ_12155 [Frigoribacterium sp. 2-23]|uniref:hypothetical protein n=1 Tax=Frigoribacterium sp. 2-23 TaxID=3415006 RepID=UPI003C6F09D1